MKKFMCLLSNVLILVIILCSNIFAQNPVRNENYSNLKRFERVENIAFKSQNSTNFFPNETGDFWEYIEEDTTTLFSQFLSLKFSISREVVADSTMSNGLTYKKVKWQNEANSVNYPSEFEFLRVDSIGNANIFYNASDHLLFDFTLDINQTYPAHLLNHYWKVLDKYNVIGFGDTLQAIDFGLFNQNNIMMEVYKIVENFGIIFYQKDLLNYALPQGNFWGAVINGQEFGTLIVKKQTVDWKEFYPLHIGDYWVYKGEDGAFPITLTIRCISDTIMSDGYLYYKLRMLDYTFGNTSTAYWRVDSLGRVFNWDESGNSGKIYLRFSVVVGDTLTINQLQYVKRHEDKYFNASTNREELHFFMYPDVVFHNEYYDYSFGLYSQVIELNYILLKGSYINGILWEDTTITAVEDVITNIPQKINVFPSYPNPFNSSTTLSYYVPATADVRISMYNTLGELIKVLFNDNINSGYHKLVINATELVSGVYFIVFNTADIQLVSKIIYLK